MRASPSTILDASSNGEELLSDVQIAQETGLNRRTLQKWRGQGKGPAFVKLEGLVRYRRRDLDRWLAESRMLQRRA
jgi:predicted DNA-binding transcriptional regulator AlpA